MVLLNKLRTNNFFYDFDCAIMERTNNNGCDYARMISIQRLTKTDRSILRELSIRTYSDTFGKYNDPHDLEDYLNVAYHPDKLTTELENEESEFYFIFVKNQLADYLKLNIGCAQTEPINRDALEIERIYIDAPYKGRGLGHPLYQKAVERAKELKKMSIWLGV